MTRCRRHHRGCLSPGLSLAAVAALLYQSVGDVRMLVILLGGIVVIAAALYLVGRGLVALIGRFRSGVGVAWRYGLANVARRGRDSAVQVVAFGLGLTVLLLLTIVRTDLLEGWRQTLDEHAPNHFMINIQPHEVDSVVRIFTVRQVSTCRNSCRWCVPAWRRSMGNRSKTASIRRRTASGWPIEKRTCRGADVVSEQ